VFLVALTAALAGSATIATTPASAHCVIQPGDDIRVGNGPHQAGAVVTYPVPGQTGSPCATTTCSPASGSFFPVGITTVTCSNTGAGSAAGSFKIQVFDTEPPVVGAKPDVVTETAPGSSTKAVTYTLPTVTDNYPAAVTPVCVPASGTAFPLGVTKVACTATDGSFNSGGTSFTVTVQDKEAPTLTTSEAVEVFAPAGERFAKVDYAAPTATDNVAGAVASCLPASGSFLPLGATTITCNADDAAGNRTTKTFSVTVRETLVPDVTKPVIQLVLVTKKGFRFVLSEPAQVTIRVQRLVKRRKLARGTLKVNAVAALNTVAFGKKLQPGRYRAIVTAVDAAGNAAAPATRSFKR
jgi:hypothetical protein